MTGPLLVRLSLPRADFHLKVDLQLPPIALTLPTILKIPDVTVPDMTVITELQEQVAKNRLFSYLGGETDEPSDTTE